MKILTLAVDLFHAERQRDSGPGRHDEANRRF
jgi:hypothetical protein